MLSGAVKENANPVVHKVQEKRTQGGRKPRVFQRLNFVEEQDADLPLARTHDWAVERTAEDRAIFLALTDVAAASPSNVSLLRKAGLAIPATTGNALRSPNFVPGRPKEKLVLEGCSKRDEIDSEEVFMIIRNIQDPEHPLTLEQLNVVNRDHIEVHDNFVASTDTSQSGQNTPLSTVDVRFT